MRVNGSFQPVFIHIVEAGAIQQPLATVLPPHLASRRDPHRRLFVHLMAERDAEDWQLPNGNLRLTFGMIENDLLDAAPNRRLARVECGTPQRGLESIQERSQLLLCILRLPMRDRSMLNRVQPLLELALVPLKFHDTSIDQLASVAKRVSSFGRTPTLDQDHHCFRGREWQPIVSRLRLDGTHQARLSDSTRSRIAKLSPTSVADG